MHISTHVPPAVMLYVLDPLERAGRTFMQQFVVLLLATGTGGLLVTQNWLLALDSAGFAAIVSLLTSALTFKVPAQSNLVDLALRVLKTFGQSFVGTLVAGSALSISGANWKGDLAIALPVALTSLLTGLAAMGVPGTNGASLLPAGVGVASDDDPDGDPHAFNHGTDITPSLDSLRVSDPPATDA